MNVAYSTVISSPGSIGLRATRSRPSSHAFGLQEWLIGDHCAGSELQVTSTSSFSGYPYCSSQWSSRAGQFAAACPRVTNVCGCSSPRLIRSPGAIDVAAYIP